MWAIVTNNSNRVRSKTFTKTHFHRFSSTNFISILIMNSINSNTHTHTRWTICARNIDFCVAMRRWSHMQMHFACDIFNCSCRETAKKKMVFFRVPHCEIEHTLPAEYGTRSKWLKMHLPNALLLHINLHVPNRFLSAITSSLY